MITTLRLFVRRRLRLCAKPLHKTTSPFSEQSSFVYSHLASMQPMMQTVCVRRSASLGNLDFQLNLPQWRRVRTRSRLGTKRAVLPLSEASHRRCPSAFSSRLVFISPSEARRDIDVDFHTRQMLVERFIDIRFNDARHGTRRTIRRRRK